jgi:hypothetical protein
VTNHLIVRDVVLAATIRCISVFRIANLDPLDLISKTALIQITALFDGAGHAEILGIKSIMLSDPFCVSNIKFKVYPLKESLFTLDISFHCFRAEYFAEIGCDDIPPDLQR